MANGAQNASGTPAPAASHSGGHVVSARATTIGLMASLRVVKDGGRLLLGFLLAVTVLVFLQNGMGMAIAEAMGFDTFF